MNLSAIWPALGSFHNIDFPEISRDKLFISYNILSGITNQKMKTRTNPYTLCGGGTFYIASRPNKNDHNRFLAKGTHDHGHEQAEVFGRKGLGQESPSCV